MITKEVLDQIRKYITDIGPELQNIKNSVQDVLKQLQDHMKDNKAHSNGISGNAATATKWAAPVSLISSGDVSLTKEVSFDGSNTVNLDTKVNASQLCGKSLNDLISIIEDKIKEKDEKKWPVGSVYLSTNPSNPSSLFGFGTWKQISQGRMLLGAGTGDNGIIYAANMTGGTDKETLSIEQIPGHDHAGTIAKTENLTGRFRSRSNTLYGKENKKPVMNVEADGCFSVVQSKLRSEGNKDSNETEYIAQFNGNHTHKLTMKKAGGGQSHNNMSPWYCIYIWKRME